MEAYIGEIRMFAGNFAPNGWALCNGQLLPIAQNTALYSILGCIYGGNGSSTFALPDLRGRAPMHWGQGPNLTARALGQQVGSSSVTLSADQIPSHNHSACAYSGPGQDGLGPQDASWAQGGAGRQVPPLYGTGSQLTEMAPQALGTSGGSQTHNNMQPYLGLNFIICLSGFYPQFNPS